MTVVPSIHQVKARLSLRLIGIEISATHSVTLNNELHGFFVGLLVELLFRCVGKAHLVDFSIEGLLLCLLILQFCLKVPLLLMHLLLVSKCVFVEHLVFLLLGCEAVTEPTIVHYFFSDLVLGIVGSDKLV